MRLHRLLFVALLWLGFPRPSHAQIILFSNLGQPNNGIAGFDDTSTRYATDFLTDGTPRTITSITALMSSTDTLAHTVTFSIFTDNGGSPGSLVLAFATPATLPANAGAASLYTATSPGIGLQANTPYWVVGQVNENMPLGTVYWDFDSGQGTDGGPFSTVPGTQFMRSTTSGVIYFPSDVGNLMFELDGVTTVPEPSSLMLMMAAGAFGAIGWRRRT